MLDFLIRFCAPYFKLAYISAWGVAQNIEGLGYFGALNNYYEEGIPYAIENFNPLPGVNIISGGILFFVLLLLLLIVRSLFAINKYAGWAGLLLVGGCRS